MDEHLHGIDHHLHGTRLWETHTPFEFDAPARIAAAVIAQAVYDAVHFDQDQEEVRVWLTQGEGAELVRQLGFEPAGVVANIERRRRGSGKRSNRLTFVNEK